MSTFQYKFFRSKFFCASVADPDTFDTDPNPDPAFHFDIDPDPDPTFNLIWVRIRLFDMDPDLCCFKEVMYLLKTVLFIHLYLIFLFSRSNRTQPEGILC